MSVRAAWVLPRTQAWIRDDQPSSSVSSMLTLVFRRKAEIKKYQLYTDTRMNKVALSVTKLITL